ncbi:enoyl-CoA hydratase [Mycolicibacterium austroafricanum]|uniref:Enoyl-CoA hydratase n=1 Tax=Mycolicibacterium austroafricanum TaxID=39687 RepID=A0ABT8HC82_MYCAO|nr:enoyl-CoA hydratase [Mycolicibacterium austroafricanum]MDN4518369.1 enoyl-CoA hydratase [Mycolicibacterium austroafricanum]QRZ08617.1 enoyl-CoA hydratase [Mycolicibacterium austroafricanum]QZT63989.1 enoyl-CoA hydratase [Mycolicibacterium austroafricanum]QZT70267.1 enoyl-CoA hydratase [Mycolicibacterium austroafricanum]
MSAVDRAAEPGIADTEPVLFDMHDSGVAVLTLNRPERMNSWGGGLAQAFYRCIDRAEADPHVRVIVLTGNGRAFCAGADMGDLDSISAAGDTGRGERSDGESGLADTDVSQLVGERHPHFLTQLRKPLIAAINGACAGIGLTHALMCDVRFAAAGAKFTTAFARRGLIAEYGISWILPRIVGWSAAQDLLLSGRTFYAEEANELGLVNQVVAPEELMAHTLAYAEDMARNCAPSSLAVIKRQIYRDALRNLHDASAEAEKLMHESMRRPDFIEGITAFFEKRQPSFPPLKEETP